jgi:pimeloyl-ACP methyl ester carboxylesterase
MNTSVDEYQFSHCFADVGPVHLHYVEMGEGPLVVMLHGFPEAWFSYRHQIPALAQAGFRVVAPDMRGYNLSDKPRGVAAYTADKVATDIAGLIRSLGEKHAAVVGHDWGGGIAWVFAALHPELLDRLVILNAPHPARLLKAFLTMPSQLRRSWYMFFFQLPRLPERLVASHDYAWVRRALRQTVRPDAFSPTEIERYVRALKQPGAVTAGINYYRAAFRYSQVLRRAGRPVTRPVQVIWGEQDPFLARELAVPGAAYAPHCQVEYLPDASHWLQHDRPDRVNQLLLDFLTA